MDDKIHSSDIHRLNKFKAWNYIRYKKGVRIPYMSYYDLIRVYPFDTNYVLSINGADLTLVDFQEIVPIDIIILRTDLKWNFYDIATFIPFNQFEKLPLKLQELFIDENHINFFSYNKTIPKWYYLKHQNLFWDMNALISSNQDITLIDYLIRDLQVLSHKNIWNYPGYERLVTNKNISLSLLFERIDLNQVTDTNFWMMLSERLDEYHLKNLLPKYASKIYWSCLNEHNISREFMSQHPDYPWSLATSYMDLSLFKNGTLQNIINNSDLPWINGISDFPWIIDLIMINPHFTYANLHMYVKFDKDERPFSDIPIIHGLITHVLDNRLSGGRYMEFIPDNTDYKNLYTSIIKELRYIV